MKSNLVKSAALALLPVGLLALAACSTSSKTRPDVVITTDYVAGVPGGVQTVTCRKSVTVTAVDKVARKVTFIDKDAKLTSYTAGPEVVNFDQIEVGDHVNATVVGRVAIFVNPPDEAAGGGGATAVALAPVGDKPGGVLANTEEISAKVQAIDVKHHRATLEFADGSRQTFDVRKDVDLTKQTVGTQVLIRATSAVAIAVEKP